MNAWFHQSQGLWQLAGWTMLHYLWLGAVAAMIGGLVRFACRRVAPAGPYAASIVTLAALALLPAAIAACLTTSAPLAGRLTLPIKPPALPGDALATESNRNEVPRQSRGLFSTMPKVIDLAHTSPSLRSAGQGVGTLPTEKSFRSPPLDGEGWAPREALPLAGAGRSRQFFTALALQLPWLWLIGAPLTFALLSAGLIGSERLRRNCTPLLAGPAFEACQRLRAALHISRRTAIAVCDGLAQPLLIGIVRPLILLPAAALAGWTPEELEMVLLHELAHVRRWDNLVNLAQRIIESLLFFHPAVWLVSRQVRRDREDCCDAIVVAHTSQPEAYASLLISIAATSRMRLSARFQPTHAAASAMADHPLAGRIRRILNLQEEPMRITRRTLAATLALPLIVVAATVYTAAAEDDKNPAPSKEGQSSSAVASGDRAQARGPHEAVRQETSSERNTSGWQAPTVAPAMQLTVVEVSPDLIKSLEDRKHILKALNDAGCRGEFELQGEGDSRQQVLTISAPASMKPRLVFESRSRTAADGQPSMERTCRVIDLNAPTPAQPVTPSGSDPRFGLTTPLVRQAG